VIATTTPTSTSATSGRPLTGTITTGGRSELPTAGPGGASAATDTRASVNAISPGAKREADESAGSRAAWAPRLSSDLLPTCETPEFRRTFAHPEIGRGGTRPSRVSSFAFAGGTRGVSDLDFAQPAIARLVELQADAQEELRAARCAIGACALPVASSIRGPCRLPGRPLPVVASLGVEPAAGLHRLQQQILKATVAARERAWRLPSFPRGCWAT
jgi:hypothetical protein